MTRIGILLGLTMLAGCGAAQDAASEAQGNVTDFAMSSVAKEQIEVYDIAKRNGDRMQTCTQAMAIAAMFLQAKEEASWKEWKAKEKADCAAAGVPVA